MSASDDDTSDYDTEDEMPSLEGLEPAGAVVSPGRQGIATTSDRPEPEREPEGPLGGDLRRLAAPYIYPGGTYIYTVVIEFQRRGVPHIHQIPPTIECASSATAQP